MATSKENLEKRRVLSHAERFWNALELEKCPSRYPQEITEYVTEVTLENGVKATHRTVRTKKLSERDKGLNWYDFSLDSLRYCGALSNLRPQSIADDAFAAVDKMESYADNLMASQDTNKNNNTTNTVD